MADSIGVLLVTSQGHVARIGGLHEVLWSADSSKVFWSAAVDQLVLVDSCMHSGGPRIAAVVIWNLDLVY